MSNNEKITFIGKNVNVSTETLKEVLGDNKTIDINVDLVNKDTVYFKVDGINHLFTSKNIGYKVGDNFTINNLGEIVTESLAARDEKVPSGCGCSLREALATGSLF